MANSLLDRYKAMQTRPVGTNTALSPATAEDGNPYGRMSTAGGQYRQLENSYGRALRILNHAARRGDAGAAMKAIDVRKQAMEDGLAPGGIRRGAASDLRLLGILDTKDKRDKMARRQAENDLRKSEESLTPLGATRVPGGFVSETPAVAPNASGGYEPENPVAQSPEAAFNSRRNVFISPSKRRKGRLY